MTVLHSHHGWAAFDRQLRVGVPTADSIALTIRRLGLAYPRPPYFLPSDADLLYYRPVHAAWRAGLLPPFLTIVCEAIRDKRVVVVRQSEELQLALVQALGSQPAANVTHWLEAIQSMTNIDANEIAANLATALSKVVASALPAFNGVDVT